MASVIATYSFGYENQWRNAIDKIKSEIGSYSGWEYNRFCEIDILSDCSDVSKIKSICKQYDGYL